MTSLDIILVLSLLGIKHFFADFVWQFDYMVREKGYYGQRGGIDHSLIHAVLTLFVLVPFAGTFDAFILAMLDGIVHYHVDWAKMTINRNKDLSPEDREFWIWLGLDQMAHFLTYVGIVAILIL